MADARSRIFRIERNDTDYSSIEGFNETNRNVASKLVNVETAMVIESPLRCLPLSG